MGDPYICYECGFNQELDEMYSAIEDLSPEEARFMARSIHGAEVKTPSGSDDEKLLRKFQSIFGRLAEVKEEDNPPKGK